LIQVIHVSENSSSLGYNSQAIVFKTILNFKHLKGLTMTLFYFYRKSARSNADRALILGQLNRFQSSHKASIELERCYYVHAIGSLTDNERATLAWLLSETFEPNHFSERSFLPRGETIEIGPRLNFTTPWSTNAVSVCHNCGLKKIVRIERSRRVLLDQVQWGNDSLKTSFIAAIHDPMTECLYLEPLTSFEISSAPEPTFLIPLKEQGVQALALLNQTLGLGFDKWDLDYYADLFINKIGRNPTNVECVDLAQSNSEHSRHWFFKGRLTIDGQALNQSLFDIVKQPLEARRQNSVIAFQDNASAICGYEIQTIMPERPGRVSRFQEGRALYHISFTAETHNFPTGVAPFPGAETGTGGRIRDVQAVGRGGLVVAGTAAYCVGNLNIEGYALPWENKGYRYPSNLASPLQIEIQASNGASDYGNKFGEPLIQGFTRSFGLTLPNRERCEWIKPIMFTGGIGQIDNRHIVKASPEPGMLIVKVGGPAYRIGVGGGSASSMIQGQNTENLDFNAVQRGDAEMEQKMNRVVRACVELGQDNPIVAIHDQGAGGNSNVIKELVYPRGGKVLIRNILSGDHTLSVVEIWTAEYQENNALLIKPDHADLFQQICRREKTPFSFIGEISDSGHIVVFDEKDGTTPVNLDLALALGNMPQKTFHLERLPIQSTPLEIPDDLTVKDILSRVLRLLQVGSKRFLTNKVDRSVTGLIARQQCAGPLHLTVSDVAVIGQSHFSLTGGAMAIGEQPIKTLLNPAAMARLAVTESLTNLVWAKISALEDVKCSANWMWAPKLAGEGAKLYDAAIAMGRLMQALGIAVDGGKDSLSMATTFEGLTVKSPGALVISSYAPCPDITRVITPDLKRPGESRLLYIDLSNGLKRTGASALAQVFGQIGDQCPDMEDPLRLKRVFQAVQQMIDKDYILAGHDVSDGGFIVAILEMAFSGDCGVEINLTDNNQPAIGYLFAEEPGLVMEYPPEHEDDIFLLLKAYSIEALAIGKTSGADDVSVVFNNKVVLNEKMRFLRAIWEETSFRIERLQANPECVKQEHIVSFLQKPPTYRVSFTPMPTDPQTLQSQHKPKVAILREEGGNGDREMASAFYMAGFEVWDVAMTDLIEERVALDDFRGVVFVGGFSYADVLDSAKGWAGAIRFNQNVWEQFQAFYHRSDTFSFGVCNGCQLMALIGWVPWTLDDPTCQPRLIHNESNRFESRFSTVKILSSPAIMLRDMQDSELGVWVAHGEGKFFFPDSAVFDKTLDTGRAPIRYIDDNREITELYPFNPNGSPLGIAALCSQDGRHLAMMPHPERTFLKWQWPWMPETLKNTLAASPWLKLFQNARQWCDETS
jgi:phosphoribosylformylglycinamidine synthase